MLHRFREPEQTVYISRDEEEFRRVETALRERAVRFRVWTTAEYPVFGWTLWDPRLLGRREKRLRRVYHVDVAAGDRPNLLAANQTVRAVTGRIHNAVPYTEII